MDPNENKHDLLTSEFIKFLNILKTYDEYKQIDDDNQIIDREAWRKVCNLRRIKIEYEFKTNTYQKEMMDKVNLIQTLRHDKDAKVVMFQHNKKLIINLEEEDFRYEEDPKVNNILIFVKQVKNYLLFKEKLFN